MALSGLQYQRSRLRYFSTLIHSHRSLKKAWLVPATRSSNYRPRTFQSTSHQLRAIRETSKNDHQGNLAQLLDALPSQCPGCGAYAQTVNPSAAGFYSPSSRGVKTFLAHKGSNDLESRTTRSARQGPLHNTTTGLLYGPDVGDGTAIQESAGDDNTLKATQETSHHAVAPVCGRCHDLIHHNKGTPVAHPSLEAIHDTIAETPHRYNHIYHVIDAADFPLSLIPALQQRLSLAPQRTVNRRSKKVTYIQGRKADLSFIITRSDLLAPKKEQVDHLMPYLVQVLREALGWRGSDIRMGNVRCVSAKRGWWTKALKEEVWGRGGGGWMVGKVNVGKSNLLESMLPKGRGQWPKEREEPVLGRNDHQMTNNSLGLTTRRFDIRPSEKQEEQIEGEGSLLPPAPQELPFPVLPIVSEMPGTTASPIRLPFGNGKGELVDLPGLARSNLGDYVSDLHKHRLVMRQRVKAEQIVIKPGQSLLLGGLVRITMRTPDVTLLAYPFLPFSGHVASTEKAIAIQTQTRDSSVESLLVPGLGHRIAPAGRFVLKWDVTQRRAGPLTAKAAVGLKPSALPFAVYSLDILIEGCGWVELVAQVRKSSLGQRETFDDGEDTHSSFPRVDIFSPEGRFVGQRKPMEAWIRHGTKPTGSRGPGSRPSPSMKGVKKAAKRLRREKEQVG